MHLEERKKERFFFVLISCKLSMLFIVKILFFAVMDVGARDSEPHKSLVFHVCIFYILDFFFLSPVTTIICCASPPNNWYQSNRLEGKSGSDGRR